jgi:hypothetical protein
VEVNAQEYIRALTAEVRDAVGSMHVRPHPHPTRTTLWLTSAWLLSSVLRSGRGAEGGAGEARAGEEGDPL